MLLNSMQGIPRSQHEEESSLLRHKIEDESSLLRRKVEELNKNTVLLIAEAGRLIQGSKQLSDRLNSFEDPSTKGKVSPITASR
jgi:uncharacterized Rossmann fold enzyme